MAEHAPERYVATMSKAKRPGKVFIDWLRNARGATSVASWSLRARKGAPVAVPLRWEDLGAIRRTAAFALAAAKQRAARLRRDPWAGFAEVQHSLPDPCRPTDGKSVAWVDRSEHHTTMPARVWSRLRPVQPP